MKHGQWPELAVLILLAVLVVPGCTREPVEADSRIRLGFVNNPLAAPLYVAEARANENKSPVVVRSIPFGSSGDVGLALLAEELDAGFIETPKVLSFLRNPGFHIPGGIAFAYGATVVLRKDLNLRLGDLAGSTMAVQSSRCRLFHQFVNDAQRRGVATNAIRFVNLPFEDMASALESGKGDAVLTQGAFALLGVAVGHKILYQNWDVSGSDLCCPATASQIEWILVVRDAADAEKREALIGALREASSAPAAEARAAISRRTRIPRESLDAFPVADFRIFTDEERMAFGYQMPEVAHSPQKCDTEGCEHEDGHH